MKKYYALYKGDKLLADGTVKEIADKMGITTKTLSLYASPAYTRRACEEKGRRLVYLYQTREVWALYKGKKMLFQGFRDDIAKYLNIKKPSVYRNPAWLNRNDPNAYYRLMFVGEEVYEEVE